MGSANSHRRGWENRVDTTKNESQSRLWAPSTHVARGQLIGPKHGDDRRRVLLGDEAHKHRKSLTHYSHSFLEGILWFSASAALVTYALYTLEHENGIFYTVPLAAFGLIRYIYIVKEGKGDPTEALLKDKQILTVGIVWIAVIGFMVY